MRAILKNRLLATTLVLAGLAMAGGDARAIMIRETNLVQLIRESNTIVKGTVADVTDGFLTETGLPYTEVTVSVDEAFIGGTTGTMTFRQFGLTKPRPSEDGTRMIPAAPEGIPKYQIGEEVLLFLGPEASMTGLRTTTALGYGKFDLSAGRGENEVGNTGVFTDVSIQDGFATPNDVRILQTTQGAVNPTDLVSLVRRAVNGAWVEHCLMWETSIGKTCVERARPSKKLSNTEGIYLNKPSGSATRVPRATR